MTRLPARATVSVGEILTRLLVVLALSMFGPTRGHADTVVPAIPSAEADFATAQGILAEPRHLPRASLPGDPATDPVIADAPTQAPQSGAVAAWTPATPLSMPTAALGILPPVRGPPAA